MTEVLAADEQWGSFRIGGHEFALPIDALVEVAPCGELLALPDVPSFVRGAFQLRGALVPVIDLRSRLGVPSENEPVGLVVVVRLGEHTVGLQVEAVTGTFVAPRTAFESLRGGADGMAWIAGCLRRPAGQVVSAIDPAALASLPGVPLARFRERTTAGPGLTSDGRGTGGADADTRTHGTESLLLLRCATMHFAIDALRVQSTMWEPELGNSVLAGATCRGVVEHRGRIVPAIDLLAGLGLGALTGSSGRQAFVVELPAGMVAFLVDAVAEIVVVPSERIRPVPGFAFGGAVPLRGVCDVRQAESGEAENADHLVIDVDRLMQDPDVQKLATMNADVAGRGGGFAGRAPDMRRGGGPELATGRRLATFQLGGSFAVPLESLVEVLPCSGVPPSFGRDHLLRRILVSRGRSIPVLDLARLLHGAPADVAPACVLVVGNGDGWLGFAAPPLEAIETARWERPMPDAIAPLEGDLRGSGAERTMARLGTGDDHRIVEVLDLAAIARRLASAQVVAAGHQVSMPSRDSSAGVATSATVPAGCT